MQDRRNAPSIDTRLPLDDNAAAGLLDAVFPYVLDLHSTTTLVLVDQ